MFQPEIEVLFFWPARVFVSRFEQIRIEQIVFEQKCIDENRGQPYMKLSRKSTC